MKNELRYRPEAALIEDHVSRVVCSFRHSDMDRSHDDTYGRLMAAAPELLAIVDQLDEWFQDGNSPDKHSVFDDDSTWGAAVKSAIAKAKGQS